MQKQAYRAVVTVLGHFTVPSLVRRMIGSSGVIRKCATVGSLVSSSCFIVLIMVTEQSSSLTGNMEFCMPVPGYS
jgi:hypothetical protein